MVVKGQWDARCLIKEVRGGGKRGKESTHMVGARSSCLSCRSRCASGIWIEPGRVGVSLGADWRLVRGGVSVEAIRSGCWLSSWATERRDELEVVCLAQGGECPAVI